MTAYTPAYTLPSMANTKSRAVTVRIPNEVLDAVDAEAEELEMSRSEVVTRRLRRTFSRALVGSVADESRAITATEDPFIPEEDE